MTQATTTQDAAPAEPQHGFWWGTGRRKTSVARVRLQPGEGKFEINGRPMTQFFTEPQHQADASAGIRAGQLEGKIDVYVSVEGGGITGQSGAVKLGVARALKAYDPSLDGVLRDNGLLTRDAREVERKKYGRAGARRRFQFSKR